MSTPPSPRRVALGARQFVIMLHSPVCLRKRHAMPEHLLVETRDRVGILRINRPQRLNALNDQLAREICDALFANDADDAIGCSVIMGSDKAFAAGADIGAMADWNYAKVYGDDYITKDWEGIRRVRKPVIAAIAGYALGGGCE